MDNLPSYAFEERTTGGFLGLFTTTYLRSCFTLEMVVESASIKFELRHEGNLLGTYRFDENRATYEALGEIYEH